MKPLVKVALVLAVCMVGGAIFWATGIFRTKPSATPSKANLNIGKTEIETTMSSSSTMSSSDKSTFSSRKVLVAARGANPLGERVASLVASELKKNRRIEQVEVLSNGVMPREGDVSPDLFVGIEIVKLSSSGILGGEVNTTAAISLSTAPWQSSHHSIDSTKPQTVQTEFKGTIDFRSKFHGVRSDRYAGIAEGIADRFSKAINEEVEKLAGKFPSTPQLPKELYGPYEAVSDFKFLKALKATRTFSHIGVLTHNETFWTFNLPTNSKVPGDVLSQLREAGWVVSSESGSESQSYYASLTKEGERLEIFKVSRLEVESSGESEGPERFAVHYSKPFSREERERALQALFAANPPLEVLLSFEPCMSREQSSEFNARLEKTPATSAAVCIQIAERYLGAQNTNGALARLSYAKALSCAAPDPSSVESSIQELARKISPKQDLKVSVTSDICREMGFIEVTNGFERVLLNRRLGEPVWIFRDQAGDPDIASFCVEGPEGGPHTWILNRSGEMSRSRSTQGLDLTNLKKFSQGFNINDQNLTVHAEKLGNNRLNYVITQAGVPGL